MLTQANNERAVHNQTGNSTTRPESHFPRLHTPLETYGGDLKDSTVRNPEPLYIVIRRAVGVVFQRLERVLLLFGTFQLRVSMTEYLA